jgi:hypothetical protein
MMTGIPRRNAIMMIAMIMIGIIKRSMTMMIADAKRKSTIMMIAGAKRKSMIMMIADAKRSMTMIAAVKTKTRNAVDVPAL